AFLGQHADVQRVAVAADGGPARPLRAQLADLFGAVRLRHQAVQARADVGEALGPVYFQDAGGLVKLVLDGVGWHNLDVRGDNVRRLIADGDAVPGVRPEAPGEQGQQVGGLVGHGICSGEPAASQLPLIALATASASVATVFSFSSLANA